MFDVKLPCLKEFFAEAFPRSIGELPPIDPCLRLQFSSIG
jgi:hypothetical protein